VTSTRVESVRIGRVGRMRRINRNHSSLRSGCPLTGIETLPLYCESGRRGGKECGLCRGCHRLPFAQIQTNKQIQRGNSFQTRNMSYSPRLSPVPDLFVPPDRTDRVVSRVLSKDISAAHLDLNTRVLRMVSARLCMRPGEERKKCELEKSCVRSAGAKNGCAGRAIGDPPTR